jgi:hypothetical protein
VSIDHEPDRQRYAFAGVSRPSAQPAVRRARRGRGLRRVARDAARVRVRRGRRATASTPPRLAHGGVYVFGASDGSLTTRRGFTSRSGAVAARRTAIEQVRRGEVGVSRETFAEFWDAVLEVKRPYVTAGTLQGE